MHRLFVKRKHTIPYPQAYMVRGATSRDDENRESSLTTYGLLAQVSATMVRREGPGK